MGEGQMGEGQMGEGQVGEGQMGESQMGEGQMGEGQMGKDGMDKGLTGGCLCGAVRYEVSAAPLVVGHCYCTDCRRSSGTSHCTHAAVPAAALALSGEVRFFDKPADSGNVVSRGFCPRCGSAVYSTNSGMPGMAFLRASSLDDLDAVAPALTVYAARAPSWAKIDDAHPVFPEMMPDGPDAAIESR